MELGQFYLRVGFHIYYPESRGQCSYLAYSSETNTSPHVLRKNPNLSLSRPNPIARNINMSYDVSTLEPKIRALLLAPDVDLTTISAKRVRKLLMEVESTLTPEVVKVNKEEINTLISQVFSEISGAQQDSEDDARSNEQKKEEGENAGEDAEEVHKSPKKKKVESVQEESDAKLARKLSSEINGRATRGAGRSQIKRATKKGGRAKKSASAVGSDDEGDVDVQKKKRGSGGFGKEYDLRYANQD